MHNAKIIATLLLIVSVVLPQDSQSFGQIQNNNATQGTAKNNGGFGSGYQGQTAVSQTAVSQTAVSQTVNQVNPVPQGGPQQENVQQGKSLGGQVPLPNVRRDPNERLARPFPELQPAHVEYLDQLLNYWETNSNKIKRYQCKFTNWTYNSMQVPMTDPETKHVLAQTISVGTIKFADPDKGLFDMERVWAFDKQLYSSKQEPFKESPEQRQKWHCDGNAIYEYLFQRKELVETPIPIEMRGERIVDGPLPFLFGAKAAELKKRYWIRVITPAANSEKGEYWLEAYPKFRRDAANFQKVEIILEKKDFLPSALTLYAPEHDMKTGRTVVKQTIKFENRKIWETEKAVGLAQIFDGLLKRPGTPFGWRRTVNDQNSRISQNPGKTNPPVQQK